MQPVSHPVQLVVQDDLERSRLTVLFRLLLAVPHYIWLVLWTAVVLVAAVVGWLAALLLGRLPASLHRFFSAYVRYVAHLTAYLAILADRYPPFGSGWYPIDVRLPEAQTQARWGTLLRLVLAIPALIVAAAFGGFAGREARGGSEASGEGTVTGLLAVVALLGWFASLATGRMPRGLRDAGVYAIGYRAQALAYLLLLTERYPNADPAAMLTDVAPPQEHPIRLVGPSEGLRRSRLTVLFRLALAIPHLVWLALWSLAGLVVAIVQWVVTLVRGRPAPSLHAFLTRLVRYGFHVVAFLTLAANPFPGFTGEPGRYPLDLELPEPGLQNRWKTAFRLILAIPAAILGSALNGALVAAAVLMWFVALVTGGVPGGLRNLAAYAIRYQGQSSAYFLFLTDAYPNACPLEGAAESTPEPAVA